jgi:hypothetical protein
MDRRSVIRQDIHRVSRRYDLFAFLPVPSLARSQFTPDTPSIVPQECHEFDCGGPTEQHHFVSRTDLLGNNFAPSRRIYK